MCSIQWHLTGKDEFDPITGAQIHQFLHHATGTKECGPLGKRYIIEVKKSNIGQVEVPVGKGYDLYLLHSER